MSVEGKVVAITGTSSGIGRTAAEVFAERGARVTGCARRADKGQALSEKIASAGGEFAFFPANLSQKGDCISFIDQTVQKYGRIDVLINNAGQTTWAETESFSEEELEETMRINLFGPIFCSQRAIHHMRGAGGGLILSVASVAGVLAEANTAAFNAAKAGLIQFSKTVAVEYLDAGIRSNAIIMGGAPTPTAGKIVREITRMVKGADAEPDWTQRLPTPLKGTSLRDIGTALVALSSDDARAINGATIAIDQGQTAGSLNSEAIVHALSGGWNQG